MQSIKKKDPKRTAQLFCAYPFGVKVVDCLAEDLENSARFALREELLLEDLVEELSAAQQFGDNVDLRLVVIRLDREWKYKKIQLELKLTPVSGSSPNNHFLSITQC